MFLKYFPRISNVNWKIQGSFTREEIDNHPLTKALKKAKSVPVEKVDIEAIALAKREVKNGEYSDGEEVFKSLGI